MDPEKQPLLKQTQLEVKQRFRPLTTEEVIEYRQEATWRRFRYCLVFMFWAFIAMCLAIITGFLMNAPKCPSLESGLSGMPTVAPVHLNLASLMYSVRSVDNGI